MFQYFTDVVLGYVAFTIFIVVGFAAIASIPYAIISDYLEKRS